MIVEQTAGLQELLYENLLYAVRYEEAVEHSMTLPYGKFKALYSGEFNSWRNRKGWAKQHNVEWDACLETFPGFLRACGPKPEPKYTLDRINHKGHYLLTNLRWASPQTQNNNKGNCVRINVGQESLTLAEIAKRSGKTYDAIRMGVHRHGEEWVLKLLGSVSPAVAAEAAWEFPPELKDELEAEYKDRLDSSQNRLRFFITFARSEHTKFSWKLDLCRYSGNDGGSYAAQLDEIKVHHNAAVMFLRECRKPPGFDEIEAQYH